MSVEFLKADLHANWLDLFDKKVEEYLNSYQIEDEDQLLEEIKEVSTECLESHEDMF
jgi:hypothetical protein